MMSQYKYKTQSEKFEFISKQHGGYYRHNFTDHAYLYNLYFPPETVFTRLKNQIHELVLNYPVAQNVLAELIGKIIDQPAERIVVGNGASELIKIVSGQLAGNLIVPVPSFNEYANAAPKEHVIEFPVELPSYQLDVDKFATAAIKANADIAIVVTPNNPTSLLVPKADLVRLAKRLEPNDCTLIIDESFLDFSENPEQFSIEPEINDLPNVAIFKSMSKAYGICGLRIGYMLTANSDFSKAVRNGVHIWNINGFAEEFLRLLPDYKREFIDSCKKVRTDRDSLYNKMCGIAGMTVVKPDANFIFCRLPDGTPSATEITRELFLRHNIYIKDCTNKTLPDSDRYLRIASRTEVENSTFIEALIDVMHVISD
jgi:threonine-phosphate decarboxylase